MILVGLDGSNASFAALDFAIEEAKIRKTKVVAIHSLYGGDRTKSEDVAKGEEILEEARRRGEKAGVEVETHLLVRGNEPGYDIISYADEINASLIVVGVRRRSAVGKLILGSVAQYVILNAKQPVVSVK
ncbi:MAG: universal stress protein [Archaeoglobales archaeon]|nr:MAG: universal stress protein [Archaeoglobales archaeon]